MWEKKREREKKEIEGGKREREGERERWNFAHFLTKSFYFRFFVFNSDVTLKVIIVNYCFNPF